MKKRILDRIHVVVYALSIVGWAALFYSLIVFDQARPEMKTVVTNYLEVPLRDDWIGKAYDKLLMLLWFCASVSFINVLLNWYLKVAYKERLSLSIFLLLFISAVAILIITM